jgi:type IV fimbrial biogenesis protein FimT
MYIPHHRQQGTTLIELVVILSIAAILLTIAVPSFAEIQKNSIRRSAVNDYWHSIFLSRNEAIKRNSVVSMCKSSTGTNCENTTGSWSNGWIVFENLDRDEPAQRDIDEPILRIYNPSENISIRSNRSTFTFRPITQGAVNGTIVFCDQRGSRSARAIIISHTGRPRQSTVDASNRPLSCPTTTT